MIVIALGFANILKDFLFFFSVFPLSLAVVLHSENNQCLVISITKDILSLLCSFDYRTSCL